MDSNKLQDINFDFNDEVSYYYGDLNRDHVKEILSDAAIGTFLIRDSTKDFDQKVLCVKEAQPNIINSYKIIKKAAESNITKDDDDDILTDKPKQVEKIKNQFCYYLFGKEDCLFSSIASILEFYSTHYLNQSPLIKPAFFHKKVICLYDFNESQDPFEDLYFKQGDILQIIEFTQGVEWWKAMDQNGSVGLVPVPLIRRLKDYEIMSLSIQNKEFNNKLISNLKTVSNKENENKSITVNESNINELTYCNERDEASNGPLNAKVIEDYTPSPYEHSHIGLRKGQIIKIIEMNLDGKWLGELNDGKKGLFPFNRVQLITNS